MYGYNNNNDDDDDDGDKKDRSSKSYNEYFNTLNK